MVPYEHIPWLLTRCQLAVVPSRSETFGRNIIEPMMAKIPVISTRVGIAESLLFDMHSGIGIAPGDTVALRRAVRYLIDNPHQAKALGENGKQLVESLLTWERSACDTVRLYEYLLGTEP